MKPSNCPECGEHKHPLKACTGCGFAYLIESHYKKPALTPAEMRKRVKAAGLKDKGKGKPKPKPKPKATGKPRVVKARRKRSDDALNRAWSGGGFSPR